MNLSELQIKPELRDKWAALDLGILMAKRWYRKLFLSWCIPAVLTYAIGTFFFYETPWLSLLIVWWLKPLYDRMPLLLLSRFLFNQHLQERLSFRFLYTVYGFDLFSALTWRRLDLRRSFNLAVTVLERQKGVARSKRTQLLQLQNGNAASWLTLTLVHLEMLICLGIIATAALFIPVSSDWAFLESFWEHPLLVEHIYNLFYLLAVCLIAPFYIACGFSLYINRRIELEAWDIELVFRHCMALREQKNSTALAKGQSLSTWATLLLASLLYLVPTSDTLAQSESNPVFESDEKASKEEILSILETPPFVIEKTVERWEWKNLPDSQDPDSNLPDWLFNLEDLFGIADAMKGISLLFEIAIWGLIGLLLFLLARNLLNNLDLSAAKGPLKKAETTYEKPEVIMGMAVTAESLPQDIEKAITEALEQGQHRLALSLLYRYSLYQLMEQYNLPLQSSHTEQECARIAAAQLPKELYSVFLSLTSLWQQQAYAHRSPEDQRVLQLCQAITQELNR